MEQATNGGFAVKFRLLPASAATPEVVVGCYCNNLARTSRVNLFVEIEKQLKTSLRYLLFLLGISTPPCCLSVSIAAFLHEVHDVRSNNGPFLSSAFSLNHPIVVDGNLLISVRKVRSIAV